MKNMNLRYGLIFVGLIFVGACGTFGQKKLEKADLQKVNKIAILSFSLAQQQPADNLGIGALTKGGSLSSTDSNSPQLKNLTSKVYDELEKGLQKALEIDVIDRKELISQAAYQKTYEQKMKGLRRSAFPVKGTEFLFVDGVLDQANFQSLTFAEKAKLAKSMGADAFVEFDCNQQISQGWGLGNAFGGGDFGLTTRSNITLYSVNSEEPIWRAQNIDGKKSRDSSEIKEGSQLDKLGVIGYESAQSSIEVLLKGI